MKKIVVLLFAIFTATFMANAQVKIAVIDFRAGAGISQEDVNGISAIFSTYFAPSNCKLIERTQINRIIYEQGFQLSSLTSNDMVRIGRILNVDKIVVGDINVIAGQYNIDVRVIDVESGNVDYKDGLTWLKSESYRDVMRKLAESLSSKMSYTVTVKSPVITLLGYLKVYPEDLGAFDTYPSNVVNSINSQCTYGYNTWRLPTEEEFNMMLDNWEQVRSTMVGYGPQNFYIYYYKDGNQIRIMDEGKAYGKPRVRLVTTGQPVR